MQIKGGMQLKSNMVPVGAVRGLVQAARTMLRKGPQEVRRDSGAVAGIPVPEPWNECMSHAERQQRIETTLLHLEEQIAQVPASYMGYPCNRNVDFDRLSFMTNAYLNNLGDPFSMGEPGLSTKEFEVGVLEWFASFWGIQSSEYWGCITHGGTESLLQGIYNARRILPEGILYTSTESHYCVQKIGDLLRIPVQVVSSQNNGEVDYRDLKAKLKANRGKPAIINANIGSTMKGAIDDVDQIVDALQEAGYSREEFYIHCDAAFFGLMLPFIQQSPKLSFEKPIGSISVSGHKFLGCKFPCGVVMCKSDGRMSMGQELELIKARDTTIPNSRNGHAAVHMWYALAQKGYQGLKQDVESCIEKAKILECLLKAAGINCMRNKYSNIVVFEHPRDEGLISRWLLACENNVAHVIILPGHTIEHLAAFAVDLKNSRRNAAFNNQLHKMPVEYQYQAA